MIEIYYFASIRESVKLEAEELVLPNGVATVTSLIDHLVVLHGESWRKVLKQDAVLVAINQSVAKLSSEIKDGDEIAFFPPVTGG